MSARLCCVLEPLTDSVVCGKKAGLLWCTTIYFKKTSPYLVKQTWKFTAAIHFSSSAVVYSRCVISEINILYCFVYVTLLSANVQALSYTELSCGAMIIFCPPAVLPSPSSPLRTLELIVCLILKNIMAQEKSSISRRWGDFWEVGEGVKQLLKEPFLAPRLIEKHYALPAAGTVKKANKWCLERASFFIRSHFLFFAPCGADFQVCLCLAFNHLVKLYTYANNSSPWKKLICNKSKCVLSWWKQFVQCCNGLYLTFVNNIEAVVWWNFMTESQSC